MKNFPGCGGFRVNGHAQAQFFLQKGELGPVFRVPHPGDGVAASHFFGGDAAQHIDFIGRSGGNQQIGGVGSRFLQHLHTGAIAGHHHHVIGFLRIPEYLLVPVNDDDVVPLR